MATTARNIWTPDAGDDYALTTDLATFADSVDAAIDVVDVTTDVSGLLSDVSDLQNDLSDLGNAIGYLSLVPTSVAGTGVSLSGNRVVASAATAISVNGVFSSTYSKYIISGRLQTSAASVVTMTLRASGTNNTSSNYDRLRTRGTGSTTTDTALVTAASGWDIAPVSLASGIHTFTIEVFAPGSAIPTTGTIQDSVTTNPMTTDAAHVFQSILQRQSTAFDGFTLTAVSGNMTGELKVIGVA